MSDGTLVEATSTGRIPRGELELALPLGTAEALPLHEEGELVGYRVYHPNGVAIGYVHLDDDVVSYERRDGDGDDVDGGTPLEALYRAVGLLVEGEGENPFLGALGYTCAATHEQCAHTGAGPCHRVTLNVLDCPAGDCAGQSGPEEE